MKKYVMIVFLPILIFAEHPDSTIRKIRINLKFIKNACSNFNINKHILFSIIFVERTQNFTWEDNALDEYLAQIGLNSSIGFCQLKLKTAYWIEKQLNDSTSLFFPDHKYKNLLKVSSTRKELISNLKNDSLNTMYAAAYLRIILSRWKKCGFPLVERTDILGTLYSTGLFYRDGHERNPNKTPRPNRFGKLVGSTITIKNFNKLLTEERI